MTISEHLLMFAGRPVYDYKSLKSISSPASRAMRIGCENRWDDSVQETFAQQMARLLADPQSAKLAALVIGCWESAWEGVDSSEAIEQLVGASNVLKNLRGLFFGDITYQEYEMSWIQQGDISPLLGAFPNLDEFGVRGGGGLRLGHVTHKKLKTLAIETGGMPRSIVDELIHSKFPALTHLELWLGSSSYGGTVEMDTLAPLLEGKLFPKLTHLGLRNRDELAAAAVPIAESPVVRKLQTLDLSMGSLNDEEAEPLLEVKQLRKLKSLDLGQNYLSNKMINRFKKANIKLKAKDQRKPYDDEDDYRFCVVGE